MHQSNHLDHRHELVLLDRKNPRSISSLMPEAFAKQMENLWASDDAPSILGINEVGLLREMRRRGKEPSALDHKVRAKFWIEFERIQTLPRAEPMDMKNILGNDFPKDSFYRFYITDPLSLAFLLCPPGDYEVLLEMVLNQSLIKLQEFIVKLDADNGNTREGSINKLLQIQKELGQKKLALEFRGRRGGKSHSVKEVDEPVEAVSRLPETPEEAKQRLADLIAGRNKIPGQA